jgi:hypothetical protein
MKRLALLTVCILLGSVLVANAEVITVTQVRTAGTTYDLVELYIQSITGAEVPVGDYLTGLKGTYSLAGVGSTFYLSTAATWFNATSNDSNKQDGFLLAPPNGKASSWINMATVTGDTRTRTGGSGNLWATFSDGMSVFAANNGAYFLGPVDMTPGLTPDDGEGYGFDNTLFAKIWVPHGCPTLAGATIFNGTAGYAEPLGGNAVAGKATQVVVAIPEPSTLALLGCSLFGLLAYAWRKRK